jgi:hypothetical protein
MMAQQLIDYRLLKNGIMSERDYTLRRENYKSGTNTVFDLQKILQSEKAKTIEAYQKGEIQAMNISNMADVEAYTDFANSKIEIDPYNPNINMSIYETKMVDGKEVRVIKNTSPVNVLKGQLLQKIPAFKLDEAVTKDVNSLGVGSDFLYEAATTSKAGSITKLIGYGAIIGEYAKKDKNGNPLYPQFADEVSKMKDAITQTVNKYFSDPYAVSSILTENTGNYSAESYTVYKEEAAKDKTKLLKKLDPITGQYVLDKDGPHYKEQEQEAREYVEKLILSKLDAKRELATTSQTQAQYPPEYMVKANAEAAGIDTLVEEQGPFDRLKTVVTTSVNNPNLEKYINFSKTKDVLASQFNKYIAPRLSGVEFDYDNLGNDVYVTVNGVKSESFPVGDPTKNKFALKSLQDFIINTYAPGATLEEKEMAAETSLTGLPSSGGVGSKYN